MAGDARSTLELAIKNGIDAATKELHTCLPGQVISFDPVEQTADIQLSIKRKQAGQLVNIPVLKAVPVRYMASISFSMTFPLVEGDEVLVVFSERSIDTWLQDGGIQDPADIRKHSLSDAFAFPMMYSQPKKITNFDPDHLQIKSRNGAAKITVKATGEVNIETTADVIVTGDVIADGISLKTHTHKQGNDSDGDVQQDTGVPQ